MKLSTFNANCPFEIGDMVRSPATGEAHTITDIACIHYVRTGTVEFCYELDSNGKYVGLEIRECETDEN